ncbi:MAG: hypothetical protein IPM54_12685 [Polyangiaceae bacterium]|nr:hypothetical protein [Polyangiaceae bacterium]
MTSNSSSDELFRDQGFRYRIARDEHGEAMARLLGAAFAHEPMAHAIGLHADDVYPLASRFIPECTANGLSVIAVPEEAPDLLAGVFINRDFKAPLPAGIPDHFPRFGPIFQALESVDALYEAQVPGLQVGQACDLWMVAVDPDGRFSRRGIARNLFRASVEVIRDRSFERCVTECTGAYSQRSAIATGFTERASIVYKDFIFDGRPIFASIPEPHRRLVLYERVLRTS